MLLSIGLLDYRHGWELPAVQFEPDALLGRVKGDGNRQTSAKGT
jgi:hypothetical protein